MVQMGRFAKDRPLVSGASLLAKSYRQAVLAPVLDLFADFPNSVVQACRRLRTFPFPTGLLWTQTLAGYLGKVLRA